MFAFGFSSCTQHPDIPMFINQTSPKGKIDQTDSKPDCCYDKQEFYVRPHLDRARTSRPLHSFKSTCHETKNSEYCISVLWGQINARLNIKQLYPVDIECSKHEKDKVSKYQKRYQIATSVSQQITINCSVSHDLMF